MFVIVYQYFFLFFYLYWNLDTDWPMDKAKILIVCVLPVFTENLKLLKNMPMQLFCFFLFNIMFTTCAHCRVRRLVCLLNYPEFDLIIVILFSLYWLIKSVTYKWIVYRDGLVPAFHIDEKNVARCNQNFNLVSQFYIKDIAISINWHLQATPISENQ